jgi:hypothetical protein
VLPKSPDVPPNLLAHSAVPLESYLATKTSRSPVLAKGGIPEDDKKILYKPKVPNVVKNGIVFY